MKCSERYLLEGVHPRILVEGIKEGCEHALNALDKLKIPLGDDQKLMEGVVRSAYMTKVTPEMAAKMTEITTEAIKIIRQPGKELGLFCSFFSLFSNLCSIPSPSRSSHGRDYAYDP